MLLFLLLLELVLVLAHVKEARGIKLRLANGWLLDNGQWRCSLLRIGGQLTNRAIRVMHLDLLLLLGRSALKAASSHLLDWEVAGPAVTHGIALEVAMVRASHWEGSRVRLVNHV